MEKAEDRAFEHRRTWQIIFIFYVLGSNAMSYRLLSPKPKGRPRFSRPGMVVFLALPSSKLLDVSHVCVAQVFGVSLWRSHHCGRTGYLLDWT